jgi:hypothetical protein
MPRQLHMLALSILAFLALVAMCSASWTVKIVPDVSEAYRVA